MILDQAVHLGRRLFECESNLKGGAWPLLATLWLGGSAGLCEHKDELYQAVTSCRVTAVTGCLLQSRDAAQIQPHRVHIKKNVLHKRNQNIGLEVEFSLLHRL
ncbi:hypothetical protein J6590_071704, partial [Homalodisca vitripennis]